MKAKMWKGIISTVAVTIMALMVIQCSQPVTKLPKKLAGLNLTKELVGNQAADVMRKMHGKTLGTDNYEIGYYGPAADNNILYLSIFPNVAKAKSDYMSMSMKLAQGTAVFTPLQFDHMEKNLRFRTTGMGKSHVFYRDSTVLVWLQMDSTLIDSGLADLEQVKF